MIKSILTTTSSIIKHINKIANEKIESILILESNFITFDKLVNANKSCNIEIHELIKNAEANKDIFDKSNQILSHIKEFYDFEIFNKNPIIQNEFIPERGYININKDPIIRNEFIPENQELECDEAIFFDKSNS